MIGASGAQVYATRVAKGLALGRRLGTDLFGHHVGGHVVHLAPGEAEFAQFFRDHAQGAKAGSDKDTRKPDAAIEPSLIMC